MEFLQWFYGYVSKMTHVVPSNTASTTNVKTTSQNPPSSNPPAQDASSQKQHHLITNMDPPLKQLQQYDDNEQVNGITQDTNHKHADSEDEEEPEPKDEATPTVAIDLAASKKKTLFTKDMMTNLDSIIQQLEAALVVQLKHHNDLYDSIDDLAADRDMYYEKLRTIESIISCFEDSKFAHIIQDIITKEDLV